LGGDRTTNFDNDCDGYLDAVCGGNDCDDTNATINPGIAKVCGNGFDENRSAPTTRNG
jgi:hypothetical protein